MSVRKKGFLAFSLVIVALLGVGIYVGVQLKRNAQAYLYGYPLVLMEQTRLTMTGALPSELQQNQLVHLRSFPDHNFRQVVRPNKDTLYSIAWFDLKAEPVILSVPDTQGRYYVMPFMDAWSNVFDSVGMRATGTEAGHYALVGPGWKGTLPDEVTPIHSPTNMVWMIGRIQTNGDSDIKNVAHLQDQFALTPLSGWAKGLVNPVLQGSVSEPRDAAKSNPSKAVDDMSIEAFFVQLAKLMGEQPAAAEDAEIVEILAGIGVVPGEVFDFDGLSGFEQRLLTKAIDLGVEKVRAVLSAGDNLENGWRVLRDVIGNYGTHYNVRAGVAMVGLGALPPEEATYPNATVDANGVQLNGAHRYKIHFAAGALPPTDTFWSLTMYDEHGFFVDSEILRYAISDRDALRMNADDSLDLIIQEARPTQDESNWLPAPKGDFALTLRIYTPKSAFLEGRWKLPKVERL